MGCCYELYIGLGYKVCRDYATALNFASTLRTETLVEKLCQLRAPTFNIQVIWPRLGSSEVRLTIVNQHELYRSVIHYRSGG